MRIAFISDLHYGKGESLGKVNPETGLNTRLEDIDKTVSSFINYCLDPKNKINIIVIGGDIYETRKPTPTQQLLFVKQLLKISEHNKRASNEIKTIICTGNHDIQRAEIAHSVSGVEELTKFYSKTLWITSEPKNYVFEEQDEKTLFCVIPYLYKQKLNMASNEQVVEFYQTLIKQALLKHKDCTSKIFVGHQTVEGCNILQHQDVNSFNEIIVPLDAFEGFDFISQGHIHKYQVLNKSPYVVFQGSPTQFEFDGEYDKGFTVFDTKLKKFRRVLIEGTKLIKIQLDVSEKDQDATDAIEEYLTENLESLKGCIVKVEIVLKESDLPLRNNQLKPLFENFKFFAKIDKTVRKSASIRSEKVTKNNSLEAILTEITKIRQYSEEEAQRYIETGLRVKEQVETV